MFKSRKRDVGQEAAEFGATLLEFLETLGALVRDAAEWLGIVSADALSSGAEVVAGQAGALASASRVRAKRARRRGRKMLFKLLIVGGLLWWLDRDLSEPSR